MFRLDRQSLVSAPRFPHASGDVPTVPAIIPPQAELSPREWGCSVLARSVQKIFGAFPTRVGMFRPRLLPDPLPSGFPHASGDVPGVCLSARSAGTLSPREWGCSADGQYANGRQIAFPTRVGMFRLRSVSRTRRRRFPHASGDVPCRISHPEGRG